MAAKKVLFWGRVQGVGFRYNTRRLAAHFAVTGYVKNLPDGQVELVASGTEAEVERFLQALAAEMADFVDGHTIQDITPPNVSDFTIQF